MKLHSSKLFYVFILLILQAVNNTSAQVDGNNWNNQKSINAEIDLFKNEPIDESCIATLNPINNFNNTVETVNNINEAGRIDIKNTQGGIVYISGDAYFAPQIQVSEFKKIFKEELGLFLDQKLIPSIEELSNNISELNTSINGIADSLKKIEKPVSKKREYLQILQEYKSIINFTQCLHIDYGEEAIIKKDIDGDEIHLFELEKIWNDPNYSLKGPIKEGFRFIKQFNKYGYKSETKEYSDIPFKYDYATNFSNGYAIVRNNMFYHIIDKKGKELLSFNTQNTTSIEILKNSFFIKHGIEQPDSQDSYFVDITGNIVSKKFDKIISQDHKNIFKGIPELKKNLIYQARVTPEKPLVKNTDSLNELSEISIPINSGTYYEQVFYLDNQGNRILLSYKDIQKIKKAFKLKGRLTYSFEQIMLLPDNTKMLFIINIRGIEYLLLKDLISEETSILKETENIEDYFKIIELPEKTSNTYSRTILGYTLNEHYDMYTSIILDNKAFTKLKKSNTSSGIFDYDKNNLRVFNIKENRSIGPPCQTINGVFSKEKMILFGKTLGIVYESDYQAKEVPHYENQEHLNKSETINAGDLQFENTISYSYTLNTGYGVMNYNGQIVIPPLFKEINYSEEEEHFNLLDYNGSIYLINTNWYCIVGNCDDYRQLIREYYPLIEKE